MTFEPPSTIELLQQFIDLHGGPDFSLNSQWQWYWPRSKYAPGQLPFLDFAGVISEPDEKCDRVRLYCKQAYAGELRLPLQTGDMFATQVLRLLRLPRQRTGCFFYKELEDGRDISVYPCWPPEARVCISRQRSEGIDDAYYYPTVQLSLAAAIDWNGTGEPISGWNRHLATNRWRKDGDPAKETIGPWEE